MMTQTINPCHHGYAAVEPPCIFCKVEALEAALTKISAIRDSIIGSQKINWSEHIYPLVAALGEAGYEGAGYEIARKNLGTLLEENAQLRAIDVAARMVASCFTDDDMLRLAVSGKAAEAAIQLLKEAIGAADKLADSRSAGPAETGK